jgi:hypothetical protein
MIRKEALLALLDMDEYITEEFASKCLEGEEGQPRSALSGIGLWRMSIGFDKIIETIMRKMNVDDLHNKIGWYDQGYKAYRVLATTQKEFFERRIRQDLQDDMDFIKRDSDEKFIAKMGKWANKYITDYEKDNMNDFIRSRYIKAAFDGLLVFGNMDDICFARKYFDEKRYGVADEEIIKLYEKYGDGSDVDRLLNYVKEEKVAAVAQALEIALKLSNKKEALMIQLHSSGIKEFETFVLNHMMEINYDHQIAIALKYLQSKNDDFRLKALAILVKDAPKDIIEELLKGYCNEESYYYNVVTWLDRYLYAPGIFGDYFRKELMKKVA